VSLAVLILGCTKARLLEEAAPRHTAGVLDPNQPDFHGTLLLNAGFNLGLCQTCHGKDLNGWDGRRYRTVVSCFSCGIQLGLMKPGTGPVEPATLTTPSTGKHKNPRCEGGALAKSFACSTCHPDHQRPRQDHAFASDGSLRTGPAQVSLTGLAALTPAMARGWGRRLWDPSGRTCSNVYCHGATFPTRRR
jgi:hypothetical protein